MIAKNVFGIVGWQNSARPRSSRRCLPNSQRAALRIDNQACSSRLRHRYTGRDSHRHRAAGAHEVLVASGALGNHARAAPLEPSIEDHLQRLAPCDLILVEGFKNGTHPKIEVIRHASAEPRLADTNPTVRAIATDDPLLAGRHRALPLHDIRRIARFICTTCDVASSRFDSDQ
jgi:molybdopterin-guanine dinucleotide biosynthesis protein MobB